MSIKVKQALVSCFNQIKERSFDENTIRTLLILSRDYIKDEGLIKELAHFIAHPIRDKGIFYKKLNNRYAKWKLVEEQVHSADFQTLSETIKTENELSDFMLGGVDLENIEAKLFEILYYDGLDDISESHLIKYTGFNRKGVAKKLKQYYTKSNGYYILNIEGIKAEFKESYLAQHPFLKNAKGIISDKELNSMLDSTFNSTEGLSYINSKKKQIDDIQRVIRGTIEFKSAITSKALTIEIITALSKIINHFKIDTVYINAIKKYKNEIQLCTMTLLHDSKFSFYDNQTADTFLCFYFDYRLNGEKQPSTMTYDRANIYKKGAIALCITYKWSGKTMTYPLFVSDLRIKDYFNIESLNSIDEYDLTMKPIPWTTANRIDGKLMLIAGE